MAENLREKILKQLRAEIIAGFVQPGTMYSAPTLAHNLGTSTTPVREALLELTRMGLLRAHRNRGFEVTEPSVVEVREIFDLREVLELHAAEVAVRKGEVDLEAMRVQAAAIERAALDADFRGYLEADRNFHKILIDGAGSRLLTENIMALRDRMRLFGLMTHAGMRRQQDTIQEHYDIVELVRDRQATALCRLLKDHVRSWEPIYVESVRQMRNLHRRPVADTRTTPRETALTRD